MSFKLMCETSTTKNRSTLFTFSSEFMLQMVLVRFYKIEQDLWRAYFCSPFSIYLSHPHYLSSLHMIFKYQKEVKQVST